MEAKEVGTSIGRALAASALRTGLDLWPLELVLRGLSFHGQKRAEQLGGKNKIDDTGCVATFFAAEGTWMVACRVAEALKDVARKNRVRGWVMNLR